MIELFALVTIFWIPVLIVLVKKYLWDLYYWQIKEYRWDRFWTHIRWDQEEQNRNYYNVGLKFILFATVTLIFEAPFLVLIAIVTSYIVWVFESFDFVSDIFTKKLIKPSLKNIRNILIMLFLIVISILLPLLLSIPFALLDRTSIDQYTVLEYFNNFFGSQIIFVYPDIFILIGLLTLLGLFLDLASPLITPFGVILTWPLSYIRRWMIINKAKKKFNSIRNQVTLIGITGSQGKTTTKELLYEVLKTKYKVAKTPENYNTDIGVSLAIMSEIQDDTEIFIAEMGAYKRGEIKKIVNSFTPDISLITDIDTQHIGIFGGRKELAEGKSEIVRYMRTNGLAVLNGDNEACREIADKLENFIILVSSDKGNFLKLNKIESPKRKYIKATNVKANNGSVSFTIKDNNEESKIRLVNFGKHLVNNVLEVIATATKLDMTISEVVNALEKTKIELPRLSIDTGDNNTIIINDSYSSSYKGFIAAVEFMNEIPMDKNAKRIVITKGILELGREKKTIYKDLMNKIRKDIDILITSDSLLYKTFEEENLNVEIIKVRTADDMIYKFREKAKPNDVVLLEGRLSPLVLQAIVSDQM